MLYAASEKEAGSRVQSPSRYAFWMAVGHERDMAESPQASRCAEVKPSLAGFQFQIQGA